MTRIKRFFAAAILAGLFAIIGGTAFADSSFRPRPFGGAFDEPKGYVFAMIMIIVVALLKKYGKTPRRGMLILAAIPVLSLAYLALVYLNQ